MKTLTLKSRIKMGKDVLIRRIDEEAVLLNLATGIYFGLDPTGARIWQLIEERGRLDRVLDSVLHEYEVDQVRAGEDLLKLACDLKKNELVEIVGE